MSMMDDESSDELVYVGLESGPFNLICRLFDDLYYLIITFEHGIYAENLRTRGGWSSEPGATRGGLRLFRALGKVG